MKSKYLTVKSDQIRTNFADVLKKIHNVDLGWIFGIVDGCVKGNWMGFNRETNPIL